MAAKSCSGVAVGVVVGTRSVGGGVAETFGVGTRVAGVCGREVSLTGDVQPASRPKIKVAMEIVSLALFIKFIIHAQSDLCNPPYSPQCVSFLTKQGKCGILLIDVFSKRRASYIRGARTLRKRKSIVPLNSIDEAFEKYSELMPDITDVRGERVNFDLGSYTHLLDDEDRLRRIGWIRETLGNPEEIRRDFVKEFPFREIYINTVHESEEDRIGESFLVVVDRRVALHFWTAFTPIDRYLQRVKRGKLLWRPES